MCVKCMSGKLQLPADVALIKVKAHLKEEGNEQKGNKWADHDAKKD